MKKLMYFAAALLVLVGCNKKDNIVENTPEGTPFEKGQEVTLTIGTGAQQGPNKVAGVDNTTDNKIDFTWEEGDQILVKVGEEFAAFTLTTGVGMATGTFSGTMPAGGSTFDIQYPIETPDLSAQVYTAEKTIPADKMLFKATNCTLGTPATLQPQNAMVQLNLYGTDKIVGMIIFKNITDDNAKPDTLTCTDGKPIGTASTTATPFYMVVPTGVYQFEVEVWDNATTPAMICSFATSAAKTFTAGQCANMPVKFVPSYVDLGLTVKWATCNVGADAPEGYGDYFAWGETEPYYKTPITDPITWKSGKESGYVWLSYCCQSDFTEWSTPPYDATTKILKPEYDAATANWGGSWRMPTKDEIDELLDESKCSKEWTTQNNVSGYKFTSIVSGYEDNSIFLPASDYRNDTSLNNVGSDGGYWSSSLYEGYSFGAYDLLFNSDLVAMGSSYRYIGLSVRPVCQ